MYEAYFGLQEAPFSLTPDTGYVYRHAGHQEAVNELLSGLQSGEGFIAVVAEVGSGKTLLCRKLLTLIPEDWAAVYLPNPLLTPIELYRAIAQELSVDGEEIESLQELQDAIFSRLIEIHTAGGQVVVMIDESQAMPQSSLEALRLLSNIETEKKKLLQVIFFAQPEFEVRLEQHAMRQLRQRITFLCRLKPMQRGEIEGYLQHRLSVAGYNGPPLFSSSAIRKIYRGSGGTPRLVNILAHKSLLAAYGRGGQRIRAREVAAAIADTGSVATGGFAGASVQFWFGLCSSIIVSLFVVFLLKGGWG